MFIDSLHQFVNEALKDIARSRFEHQIIDNLSGFLEEFCNRSDIEKMRARFDNTLNQTNQNINNGITEDKEEMKNNYLIGAAQANSTVTEDITDKDKTDNEKTITWYIIVIGIVLFCIIAVIAIIILLFRNKDQEKVARKLFQDISTLDAKIGRKLYNFNKSSQANNIKVRLIL